MPGIQKDSIGTTNADSSSMLIIGLPITLVTPGIVQARDHHAHSHHGNP